MCLIKFHFTISFVNIMIFPYYNSYLGQSKNKPKKTMGESHSWAEQRKKKTPTRTERNFVPDRFHYKCKLLHVNSVEKKKKKKLQSQELKPFHKGKVMGALVGTYEEKLSE